MRKYPDALLFPMSHGYVPEEMAPIVAQAALGDQIFTVDCVMGVKEFLAAGHKVTSLDHHAGVRVEYEQIAKDNPSFKYIFDNSKSGSSISWSYFFPSEKMPEIIAYVEDYDLWNWKFGECTKDVANYLYPISNKPDDILKLFDKPLDDIKKNGHIITVYSDFMIRHSIKDTEPIDLLIAGHKVPFYNITSYKSESGNILSTERGQTIGLFTIDGPKVNISLRCLDAHTPSALDIAKVLGGGGHRNASGAGMSLEDFIQAIVKK